MDDLGGTLILERPILNTIQRTHEINPPMSMDPQKSAGAGGQLHCHHLHLADFDLNFRTFVDEGTSWCAIPFSGGSQKGDQDIKNAMQQLIPIFLSPKQLRKSCFSAHTLSPSQSPGQELWLKFCALRFFFRCFSRKALLEFESTLSCFLILVPDGGATRCHAQNMLSAWQRSHTTSVNICPFKESNIRGPLCFYHLVYVLSMIDIFSFHASYF